MPNNSNLIAAQQEVVSIKNMIQSILNSESVITFSSAKTKLIEMKNRLFELLYTTQNSDQDDLLSAPVADLVKEIDTIISGEQKATRTSE
jgi:hypothetical protein